MFHFDLIDTLRSERLKTLSVWKLFRDEHLSWRPPASDGRGRSVHEQFVHQCVSEERWFAGMLGIVSGLAPLPAVEDHRSFLRHYADGSRLRCDQIATKPLEWWNEPATFFDVPRSRHWIVMRRLIHTSHHRGQLTAYARSLGLPLWSTFGPTADTGGLMADKAPTIYAYADEQALLGDTPPAALPPRVDRAVTERPGKA